MPKLKNAHGEGHDSRLTGVYFLTHAGIDTCSTCQLVRTEYMAALCYVSISGTWKSVTRLWEKRAANLVTGCLHSNLVHLPLGHELSQLIPTEYCPSSLMSHDPQDFSSPRLVVAIL